MAKKHKNLDNIPIKWNGDLDNPPYGAGNKNQNIPTNHNFTWGGHGTDGYTGDTGRVLNQKSRTEPNPGTYFEDYDINGDGVINVSDNVAFDNLCLNENKCGNGTLLDILGSPSVDGGIATENGYLFNLIAGIASPPKRASEGYGRDTYTWSEVNFVIEIADGVGTGGRRVRQDRLDNLLKNRKNKRKVVHLICRIKGEKVYDEKKEVNDIMDLKVKIEDVDMIINEVLGKIKVETKDVL
tara:strand:+ start:130 stop:849 length:720 start_codon:yes stop_codon:yes gene_type:complete